MTRAEALIAGHEPAAVVGAIERRGAAAVIPPRPNRTRPRAIDRHLDRERNPAERHIGRIKRDRRVATRDDRAARDFLAFVHVASIMTLLL